MKYKFEWDRKKANSNKEKHKISFQRAVSVFRDPCMISIFDDKHSDSEDRWITLGIDTNGTLLVISHTFHSISSSLCKIRIISARKATKAEETKYKELAI
jgi:uncharacterized protein